MALRAKNLENMVREVLPIESSAYGAAYIENKLRLREDVKTWIKKYYISRSEAKRKAARNGKHKQVK